VLIYRSTGIVNFAQGELAMFSTFIAWGLVEAGVALGFAILLTLGVSLLGGMLIERVLIRPVEGGQELTLVTVTLGLFILVNGLARWIWGSTNRGFPSLFPDGSVNVAGVGVAWESLGLLAVLLGVVGVLWLVFQHTTLGLAMRAAAVTSTAILSLRSRVTPAPPPASRTARSGGSAARPGSPPAARGSSGPGR